MKKSIVILLIMLFAFSINTFANQKTPPSNKGNRYKEQIDSLLLIIKNEKAVAMQTSIRNSELQKAREQELQTAQQEADMYKKMAIIIISVLFVLTSIGFVVVIFKIRKIMMKKDKEKEQLEKELDILCKATLLEKKKKEFNPETTNEISAGHEKYMPKAEDLRFKVAEISSKENSDDLPEEHLGYVPH